MGCARCRNIGFLGRLLKVRVGAGVVIALVTLSSGFHSCFMCYTLMV